MDRCLIVNLGNMLISGTCGTRVSSTTFREDRSGAEVGPGMWAGVLGRLSGEQTKAQEFALQEGRLMRWYLHDAAVSVLRAI